MLLKKGRHEAKAKKNPLAMTMTSVILVVALSCVAFVGTTLAWFSANIRGTANEITAGTMSAKLVVLNKDGSAPVDTGTTFSDNETVKFYMHRIADPNANEAEAPVPDNYDRWVPGGYYASDTMQVYNIGDIPFNLMLAVKPNESFTATPAPGETETGLDAAASEIPQEVKDFMSSVNYEIVLLDEHGALTCCSSQYSTLDSAPIDVNGQSMKFYIRASIPSNQDAIIGDTALKIDEPFSLCVLIEQAGREGESSFDNNFLERCSNDHEAIKAKNDAMKPCINDDYGYWEKHSYYCAICGEKLIEATDGVKAEHHALFMQELAEKTVELNAITGQKRLDNVTLVQTSAGFDVYCNQCSEKIGQVMKLTGEGGAAAYKFYLIGTDGVQEITSGETQNN